MSKILGVSQVIELLEKLRSTVREFAAKEEIISSEWRRQSVEDSKAYEAARQSHATQLAESIAKHEDEFQRAQKAVQARFALRQARIEQAYRTTQKRVLAGITERQDRSKYTLQKRSLDATRQRDADLAQAAGLFEDMQQQVAQSRERFAILEADAQKAGRGVGEFRRWLALTAQGRDPDPEADESRIMADLADLSDQTQVSLRRFKRNAILGLFRHFPLWLLLALTGLAYGVVTIGLPYYGIRLALRDQAHLFLAGLVAGWCVVYFLGKRLGRPLAKVITDNLAAARRWHEVCLNRAETRHRQDVERVKLQWDSATRQIDEEWQQMLQDAEQARAVEPPQVDVRRETAVRKNNEIYRRRLEVLASQQQALVAGLREAADARWQDRESARAAKATALEETLQSRWQTLERDWKDRIQPLWEEIRSANEAAAQLFPDWSAPSWNDWAPSATFANAAKFGQLDVDLEKLAEATFEKRRLSFPGPVQFSVPLLLSYPEQGSLLLETASQGASEAAGLMNSVVFRLLAGSPPGKVSFTIIDPVGLGQNFAGLMHLADYEEDQISGRIWTQPSQIEERLLELTEHMEKVIQMYLRNEYATIAEFNAHAGSVAEKYHILVIAAFPMNFSEAAARRLMNIASSGARCGVYLLMAWDQRQTPPHDFVADELRKNTVRLVRSETDFYLAEARLPGVRLQIEAPPSSQFATGFLRKVGESARGANRVEVPFAQVAPQDVQRWTSNTAAELSVPVGQSGANKWQYFALGKGTRQHALVAGKTGSGKSNLFHVIITNLALWCSPDQVEFYLVDFKKGVEFKCYAHRRLPHARVIAIESDREFGLSVLQRVDEELRRRGDLFRKVGVQEFAGFRTARPAEAMPRLLLIIDEFQEFFTEEDRISQAAAVLLDRLVRQGRAFGIHVILGSQTLGGAYTLARATIGQMVVRIALQCNEADAYLIMDESNPAPRLLSRPGEGIYNDMAGAVQANSPFQAVWLPDEVRDRHLEEIRRHFEHGQVSCPSPIVFEGNAPAEISENPVLRVAMCNPPTAASEVVRIWLGAPNSIKGPTEVVFQRQSANHLLVVGQAKESALTIVCVALLSIAAQCPTGTVRLILLETTAPGSSERALLDRVVQAIGHPVLRPKRDELAEVLSGLAIEVKRRTGDETAASAPSCFLLVAGLEEFKSLRQEDEFAFSTSESEGAAHPARSLLTILDEGSSKGIHLLATIDTYNNVVRCLGRKALSEFQWRVLFQMSASDSANLIDNPDASRLGLNRALLYNDREGYIEKFRPYALVDNAWLEEFARSMRKEG